MPGYFTHKDGAVIADCKAIDRFKRLPLGDRQLCGYTFQTGDLVAWRADEELDHVGRVDDQVKVNGVRTELGDISAAALHCPGVDSALAVATKDVDGATRVVLCAAPAVAVDTLLRQLATHLPSVYMPSTAFSVPSLPLLPNGKVDRKLLEAFASRLTLDQTSERSEPTTILDSLLTASRHAQTGGLDTSMWDALRVLCAIAVFVGDQYGIGWIGSVPAVEVYIGCSLFSWAHTRGNTERHLTRFWIITTHYELALLCCTYFNRHQGLTSSMDYLGLSTYVGKWPKANIMLWFLPSLAGQAAFMPICLKCMPLNGSLGTIEASIGLLLVAVLPLLCCALLYFGGTMPDTPGPRRWFLLIWFYAYINPVSWMPMAVFAVRAKSWVEKPPYERHRYTIVLSYAAILVVGFVIDPSAHVANVPTDKLICLIWTLVVARPATMLALPHLLTLASTPGLSAIVAPLLRCSPYVFPLFMWQSFVMKTHDYNLGISFSSAKSHFFYLMIFVVFYAHVVEPAVQSLVAAGQGCCGRLLAFALTHRSNRTSKRPLLVMA